MGLFDKIKSALKGTKETTEVQKKQATAKKEVVAENAKKPKAPPKPACEKGECVVCGAHGCGDRLYFTCELQEHCPKKEKYPLGKLWDEKAFPIFKEYKKYEKTYSSDTQRSIANKIVKTYVPELNSFDFVTFIYNRIQTSVYHLYDNVILYFVNMHKNGFEANKADMDKYYTVANRLNEYSGFDVLSADWLYNPSLYESDNLSYVVNAFIKLSNKKYIDEHLLDSSVVDLREFYNEDGTIKKAGTSEEDGDTISNIIEKWCYNNENQEAFERDKQERLRKQEEARRREICYNCARYSNCQTVGMHANCPAYFPAKKW